MRVRAVLPFLVVALATGGTDRPARADGDPVAKAKAEMAQLDYDPAIALLEQAEASGKNDPAAMAEIFRALAESHAAMGRAAAAETAFRRLLALDPAAELPAGSSPKLTAPFAAAREFLAGRKLDIECRRGGPDAATLVVQSDPVDLVAGGRLLAAGDSPLGEDASGRGRIALAVPEAASPAGCAALDRHGNVLARADLAAAAIPAVSEISAAPGDISGPAPAVAASSRPLYARWWLYAGLGALSGGVAAYYGLKTKEAEDDLRALNEETRQPQHDVTYADALAVEDRGERYARNTNIALVVTGVFAAVSGGLLVHQLVTERDAGEPEVAAAPLPGGASVHLTLGF
jgi:tetratricopeptide (TPR) repeat protein